MAELIIGIISVILIPIFYFIGRRDGKKEKEGDYVIAQIDKLVDQYLEWERTSHDNGIHALPKLGLEILGTDANIREAINKIEIMSGSNPFYTHANKMKNVDLFLFFKYIRENKVDVYAESVDSIIAILK